MRRGPSKETRFTDLPRGESRVRKISGPLKVGLAAMELVTAGNWIAVGPEVSSAIAPP